METISYSEKKKGWNSFHDFEPDAMGNINNRFYTIKNGQLYLHNVESVNRNIYYGEQFTSKISAILNQEPDDDKIFKTVFQEGDDAWDATLITNLTNGTITKEEFNKRNSIYHAHTRRNENENDFHGGAVQGIGNIESVLGNNITVGVAPELVNTGSKLFQLNGNTKEEIGTITAINGKIITVLQTGVSPIIGLFCFEKKNSRVEGGDIRGYYMRLDLENDNTEQVELFAVGSNVIKSHP